MRDDQQYPPWEPPFCGSEEEHLLGSLDRLRATFRWKADGLDASQLGRRIPSSTLSLGGLLKHLAVQEDYASAVKIGAGSMPDVWRHNDWDRDPDWEFTSAGTDPPALLYGLYDDAVERSRAGIVAAIGERGLSGESGVALPDGSHASIRRILFDLVEEYGRHLGHADLLREAVDGASGEDPPPDWRP